MKIGEDPGKKTFEDRTRTADGPGGAFGCFEVEVSKSCYRSLSVQALQEDVARAFDGYRFHKPASKAR